MEWENDINSTNVLDIFQMKYAGRQVISIYPSTPYMSILFDSSTFSLNFESIDNLPFGTRQFSVVDFRLHGIPIWSRHLSILPDVWVVRHIRCVVVLFEEE